MNDEQLTPVIDVGEAISAVEKSHLDVAIATAKKYPRNVTRCKHDAIAIATMDTETSESCFYKYERGGKVITGPSIRCAEIVASSWGNLKYGSRVLGHDGKTVKAQAICHDLEKNVQTVIEVDRRITDKNGRTYNDDMIAVTGMAAAAIARRNAVFGTIPQALVKAVYDAARKVAIGEGKPMKERVQKCLDTYAKLGVKQDQILAKIGKPSIDQITPDDLELLLGTYTAIRDGETTIDEQFGPQSNRVVVVPAANKPQDAAASGPNAEMIEHIEGLAGMKPALFKQVLKDRRLTAESWKACERDVLVNLLSALKEG